jgi:putative ABC transport system permease protein
VAGVTFANILVLVQLGIMGSFSESVRMSYQAINGDVLISANDADTFFEGSNIPRQWSYRALSVPGVAAAMPIFLGKAKWIQPDGSSIEFQAVGIDPTRPEFLGPGISDPRGLLQANTALADRSARGLDPKRLATVSSDNPLTIEVMNQQLTLIGTVSFGGGFAGDGYIVVSDQTFMRMFPKRSSGAPDHILLVLEQDAEPAVVIEALTQLLPEEDLRIRSFDDAIAEDIKYQTTVRPTGLIFGFGVVIGIIVGIVIVYQVLSTDVADHIREYATFKAMGYNHGFLLGIVFEEAVILALAGFLPGIVISTGLYTVLSNATNLPIEMDLGRALMVFAGTLASCIISGAIATRRLATADPADLF